MKTTNAKATIRETKTICKEGQTRHQPQNITDVWNQLIYMQCTASAILN